MVFLKQSVADGIGIPAPDDAGETLRLQELAEHDVQAKEAALVVLQRREIIRLAVMRSGQSMSTLLLRRTQHAA